MTEVVVLTGVALVASACEGHQATAVTLYTMVLEGEWGGRRDKDKIEDERVKSVFAGICGERSFWVYPSWGQLSCLS